MRDRDEGEQSRKLFIGGLDYDTTDEKLRQHFEQWGELTDHVVMKFPDSKRSRGFGFVTYATNSSVDNCLDSMPHTIDNKTVEIKRATPREDDRRRGRGRFDDDEEYDPESKQMRKLFVGGLSYQTSEEQLREYFEQYGDLVDSVVMKFPDSGRSRGFGFVTFEKAYMVDNCQKARPHELDGKTIETKRATPKSDAGKPEAQATVKKIFVGGLSDEIEDEDLKEYFGEFGKVTNVDQLRWNDTGKKRGFGFVEFDDHDAVDKIVLIPRHPVKDRKLEVKKALSKSEMEIVKKATQNDRFGGRDNFRGSMGGGGGYNRGSMGMGGGNMGMGNNMGMGMGNNMGMGMGMNNMGMGMGMGNNMGMGMNNMGMGMGMNNMGMGMGNMGMGGGMGGNMGGGMGGNMGGGMGGGGGGMGGGNRGRNMDGDSEKSKSDPVYSTNTGANPGYKTEGGNSGNMGGGGMGGGMGGNMGMGGMGGGMGGMGGGMGMGGMGGGMGMGNMGMGGGMGNMGMGGGMGGGNMGGGMGGGNMGGRSGGGPMRAGGAGGSGGRDAPYSRGGGGSSGRGGSRW